MVSMATLWMLRKMLFSILAFRKWANNVLKQFILKGYAINEKRLQALKKTVDIQSRMLADALDIEEKDVLRAVNEYTDALILLDQYDHQTLSKPKGSTPVYRITYEECVQMVGQMKDSFETDVFGVEKEAGKVQGIIAAVYQSVFGQDAYPSLEEKAANLLYFMIKDHPYADGCKRIAASLFLEFLDKNNALFLDGEKRLSDGTLVAIPLRHMPYPVQTGCRTLADASGARSFCVNLTMVQDRANGTRKDFNVSPISKAQIGRAHV